MQAHRRRPRRASRRPRRAARRWTRSPARSARRSASARPSRRSAAATEHVDDVLRGPQQRRRDASPAREARRHLRRGHAAHHPGRLPRHRRGPDDDVPRHADAARQLAENVVPDGATPMFRYYAYSAATVRRPRRSRCAGAGRGAADLGAHRPRVDRLRRAAPARHGASAARAADHVHATTCTSAPPTRTTRLPTRHAHEPPHPPPRRLADESGFSMLAVMIVMIAATTFVVGGFAAANGDLPMSRNSQDRKATYAAAESGRELLPVPPQLGQRLLDEVHERREAERDREQPGQPEVGNGDGRPTRASGATSPARRRSTRSSCSRRTGYTTCVEGNQSRR